ncbi:carbohydrate kinase family protein [Yoonia sediminilitoris]|uniref:Fructokinase n=1 Tax=Yoonia sediminilitoris TaxID=1286148 RepID=A0A2T6KQC9_9RHOB|nr:carbohydrate kinase [Yoonia sediminilitoris]PUB18767.1 fructokinase [Yoonia sediminilitoris]RCW98935.1 fructokinase [Yoonia sediminilitoris]
MILCCGEALIDMLPRQTSNGEKAFAPHAGGAVFNTAIALGRQDVPVQFFSGLSSDLFGDMLRAGLAASQVDSSLAATSDRPTTLAFVTLTDGQASYAFYDENTAGRMLSVDDLPEVTAQAVFFGGISLAVEPCAMTYQTLLDRVAGDKVTMIDPNIRPSFIKDEATYRARITAMMAQSDIIKMSDEDLDWFVPDGTIADKAHSLLDRGAKLVCVTEGAKGVTGYTADHALFVPAQKATVVDTVGAGDTFNAGLLAGLHAADALSKEKIAQLDADTIRAALARGAKSAAITVSRAGANPPWTADL